MILRTTALVAIAAAGAITMTTAPAHADPGARYRAGLVGDSVVTMLDNATFTIASDSESVLVRDGDGHDILALPLVFELDGARHPILQRISDDGRTLVLTPDAGLRPVASPMENQLALSDFASTVRTGTLNGTVGGFVLGALVGAAVGLGSCLVVGPGCLATTPAAIAAFASGGMLLGTLGAGGAAVANGAWKYLTTLQAEPGTSSYADKDGLLDPDGTGVPDANLRLPTIPFKPLISGSSSGSHR